MVVVVVVVVVVGGVAIDKLSVLSFLLQLGPTSFLLPPKNHGWSLPCRRRIQWLVSELSSCWRRGPFLIAGRVGRYVLAKPRVEAKPLFSLRSCALCRSIAASAFPGGIDCQSANGQRTQMNFYLSKECCVDQLTVYHSS